MSMLIAYVNLQYIRFPVIGNFLGRDFSIGLKKIFFSNFAFSNSVTLGK